VAVFPAATDDAWRPPAGRLEIPDGVDVWRIALASRDADAERHWEPLSSDERERASRFRFEPDRCRFVSARAAMRAILGRYLDTPAVFLQFGYGHSGKPHLEAPAHGRTLSFNLSHSHELALLAVCRERPLGVDIEWMSRPTDIKELAARMFAAGERDALERLADAGQVEGFFNCWTRKEAYVKATGDGLATPLHRFEMEILPGIPPALRWHETPGESVKWRVRALHPGRGYAAALVTQSSDEPCRCWDWV
jgi:4'-phosphopantetheinyl transferase